MIWLQMLAVFAAMILLAIFVIPALATAFFPFGPAWQRWLFMGVCCLTVGHVASRVMFAFVKREAEKLQRERYERD